MRNRKNQQKLAENVHSKRNTKKYLKRVLRETIRACLKIFEAKQNKTKAKKWLG